MMAVMPSIAFPGITTVILAIIYGNPGIDYAFVCLTTNGIDEGIIM
jgi:hypothetical protein